MKKNKYLSPFCFALLLSFPFTAQALSIPQGSKSDPRIQTVTYSADNVINIRAKVGRAVLVQLEEDEHLDDDGLLGMGDSQAWNLAVKGNNILFKPTTANPDTNLLVTTNKRTYAFQLTVDESSNQAPTYILRFRYPDTQKAKQQAAAKKQAQAHKVFMGEFNKLDIKIANKEYWGYGDKVLAPTAMYDDGRFTYLEFKNGRDLPSVYKIMPDGTESLLNTHVKGATLIIHELNSRFVLRLGNNVLGVDNRGFNASGSFNHTGAADPRKVRLIKEQK